MRARSLPILTLLAIVVSGCWRGDDIDRSTVRNLVVITVDTTRADRIGAYGYTDIKTPHIDGLAERGVLFETAITPVPLTLPSHTSIFTGQLPTHHGVRNNGTYRVPKELETLAEVLRRNDFRTGAVIGAFVLDSKYGLDQGFDTYDDNLHGGKDGPMFMFDERPGRMVTDQGLTWLEANHRDRFFLWLHYFDPHANYEPPPPFDVLYEGAPYDGEIAGVDAQIGRLVDRLRDLRRLDDTLIVLTSDHGESLGEHGEKTHSLLLYDATLRVPLIFSHPALPQGSRVGGQVGTIDIMPTALDLLEVEPPGRFDGRSLTGFFDGTRPADGEMYVETFVPRFNNGWSELRGVRTADLKYIRAPRSELYDLPADPGELDNLLPGHEEEADPLRADLDRYIETDVMLTGESDKAAMRLTSVDRERLAALGYDVDSRPATGHGGDLPDPKDKIVLWEEFQAAQQLMRERRHAEAAKALRRVTEQDPGNVMAHSSLGNAMAALGEFEAARQQYETVLALDPRRHQTYLALSRLDRRKGDYEAAFETLKKALAMQTEAPEIANEFADLFQETGNTAKAVEWYEEALRRDPLFIKAMIGLSNAYHRAGRESDAARVLEAALEIDPRNADALYNLGVVRDAQAQPTEAVALYRRALEVDPDHVPSLNNLGSSFDRDGNTARAVATYRRVLELSPDHFEANYNFGTLLMKMERFEEGTPRLEHALELNPRAGVVYNNLASAYIKTGRLADARRVLTSASEGDATNPSWNVKLARVEQIAGNDSTAARQLARAIELGGPPLERRLADDPDLAKILAQVTDETPATGKPARD